MAALRMGNICRSDWKFIAAVTQPALILAPTSFLDDIRANLASEGIQDAVADRDMAPIFDWLMKLVQLQGTVLHGSGVRAQ